MPPPGQAHVYRVTASQQGQVFGGYTVVLLGSIHRDRFACFPDPLRRCDKRITTPGFAHDEAGNLVRVGEQASHDIADTAATAAALASA